MDIKPDKRGEADEQAANGEPPNWLKEPLQYLPEGGWIVGAETSIDAKRDNWPEPYRRLRIYLEEAASVWWSPEDWEEHSGGEFLTLPPTPILISARTYRAFVGVARELMNKNPGLYRQHFVYVPFDKYRRFAVLTGRCGLKPEQLVGSFSLEEKEHLLDPKRSEL